MCVRACVARAGMHGTARAVARAGLWGRVPRGRYAALLLQLLAPRASAAGVVVMSPLGYRSRGAEGLQQTPRLGRALERSGRPARRARAHGQHGARDVVETRPRLLGEVHVVEARRDGGLDGNVEQLARPLHPRRDVEARVDLQHLESDGAKRTKGQTRSR